MKFHRLIVTALMCITTSAMLACACNREQAPEQDSGKNDKETAAKSSKAELTSITFLRKNSELPAEVDQDTRSISVTVTTDEQMRMMASARARYEISEGATISPDPADGPRDYTVEGGVQLTVTAENGVTSNAYTVTVSRKEAPKVKAKPVALWFDAEANFQRLATKASIKQYIDKAYEAGINSIIVDIKPVQGDVLYESSFLPMCKTISGYTIENRGFDYMQYFIDEARKKHMRVTVSTTILTMGLTASKTGPAYTDPWWNDKMCVEYLPTGFRDIRETDDVWSVFGFVNPVHPEVRQYVKKLVQEVASKYDVDGYALDYCRYMNINSDFSDLSRQEFEKWLGAKVENWPEDIYSYASADVPKTSYNPGKLYNKWVEWRATVIQGLVTDIRKWIHEVRPECDIEYWAASWWPLPHTGQNWASPTKDSSKGYWWANGTQYYKTGFADQLDIFQLGAYLDRVYGVNDNESVEYAINRALNIINGDCKLYGTIQCANGAFDLASAIDLSLQKTDGCMIFELSHVINNNKWGTIREGVDRAWKALGVNDLENIELWH